MTNSIKFRLGLPFAINSTGCGAIDLGLTGQAWNIEDLVDNRVIFIAASDSTNMRMYQITVWTRNPIDSYIYVSHHPDILASVCYPNLPRNQKLVPFDTKPTRSCQECREELMQSAYFVLSPELVPAMTASTIYRLLRTVSCARVSRRLVLLNIASRVFQSPFRKSGNTSTRNTSRSFCHNTRVYKARKQ